MRCARQASRLPFLSGDAALDTTARAAPARLDLGTARRGDATIGNGSAAMLAAQRQSIKWGVVTR